MYIKKNVNTRYYSLDFWRGIACIAVIIFHSTYYVSTELLNDRIMNLSSLNIADWMMWMTSRLWLGVPIFFVISGYCISASADSHIRHGYSTSRYFLRRFRRVYPPLWVFVAIFSLFVGGVELIWPNSFSDVYPKISPPWSFSVWNWFGGLTLTEPWRSQFFGGNSSLIFDHMWTLCYEVQFYIAVGLMLSLRKHFSWTNFVGLTLLCAIIYKLIPQHILNTFFLHSVWLQFASGIAVFYVVNYAGKVARYLVIALLLASLCYQFTNIIALTAFRATPSQYYVVSLSSALLLILLHRYDIHIHNNRLLEPISYCGKISYSVYLVHWPIAKIVSHTLFMAGLTNSLNTLIATIPVSIIVSICVGWIFHVKVERKFISASA